MTLFVNFPQLVPGVLLPLVEQDIPKLLKHFITNDTVLDEVMQEYPITQYKNYDDLFAKLLRDVFFTCPSRALLIAATNTSSRPSPARTFLYHFNHTIHDATADVFGDFHSCEIAYVWGHPKETWDASDALLSKQMQCYWGAFARTGDPNNQKDIASCSSDASLPWPEYSIKTDLNMVFDSPLKIETSLIKTNCDFWDRVGYTYL